MTTLFKPSRFLGDWYGYATNQLSHMLIGQVSAIVVASSAWWLFGEFPERIWAWLAILAAYLAWGARKWGGWDSIEDTMFFAIYGAGVALFASREIVPGGLNLVVDLQPFLMTAPVVAVHLAVGVWFRWKQANAQPDG